MRIRREDQPPKRRENKDAPIRTAYNTAPGCSAWVSTHAPGLRPHGFLDWSGCSNSLSRLRDETSLALKGFSQHAAGVRSGGRKPPLRSRPRVSALIQKTTSPSATLGEILPVKVLASGLPVPMPMRIEYFSWGQNIRKREWEGRFFGRQFSIQFRS